MTPASMTRLLTRASRACALPREGERLQRWKVLVPVLWLALIAVTEWRLPFPDLSQPTASGTALAVVTLLTALTARYWWRRPRNANVPSETLPSVLYTLYLAVLILHGPHLAILLAALVPLVAAMPDMLTSRTAAVGALWRAASGASALVLTAFVYTFVSIALPNRWQTFHTHIVGAVAAAVVLLGCLAVIRSQARVGQGQTYLESWQQTYRSPAMRFQALLLLLCPLLPLAELVAQLLDGLDANFAWVILLAPIFVVYYMAITSISIDTRRRELQQTVEQLRRAQRREEELTGYAALITSAQEEERRRLARELHDDTAQALVALARGLDTLSHQFLRSASSEEDARFVSELGDLANRSLDSIRRACRDLRPSVLDDLGLAPALASLAHDVTERGLACELLEVGARRQLPPASEVTIYRIAQESVTNARRHAQARACAIELHYLPNALRLVVRDDGTGFDSARALHLGRQAQRVGGDTLAGLGLLGMRERASLIGARLSIESRPGAGARIVLDVPYVTSPAASGGTNTAYSPF